LIFTWRKGCWTGNLKTQGCDLSPKRLYVGGLVSNVAMWDVVGLGKDGPSGRSLGHWGYILRMN
jgi:hypothetical protein